MSVKAAQTEKIVTGEAGGMKGVAKGEAAPFKKFLASFLSGNKERIIAAILLSRRVGDFTHLHPVEGLESIEEGLSLGRQVVVVDGANDVESGGREYRFH